MAIGQNFWPTIWALDPLSASNLTAWPFDHSKYCGRLSSNCLNLPFDHLATQSENTLWPIDHCFNHLLTFDFILTVVKAVTDGIRNWPPIDWCTHCTTVALMATRLAHHFLLQTSYIRENKERLVYLIETHDININGHRDSATGLTLLLVSATWLTLPLASQWNGSSEITMNTYTYLDI